MLKRAVAQRVKLAPIMSRVMAMEKGRRVDVQSAPASFPSTRVCGMHPAQFDRRTGNSLRRERVRHGRRPDRRADRGDRGAAHRTADPVATPRSPSRISFTRASCATKVRLANGPATKAASPPGRARIEPRLLWRPRERGLRPYASSRCWPIGSDVI